MFFPTTRRKSDCRACGRKDSFPHVRGFAFLVCRTRTARTFTFSGQIDAREKKVVVHVEQSGGERNTRVVGGAVRTVGCTVGRGLRLASYRYTARAVLRATFLTEF